MGLDTPASHLREEENQIQFTLSAYSQDNRVNGRLVSDLTVFSFQRGQSYREAKIKFEWELTLNIFSLTVFCSKASVPCTSFKGAVT